MTSVTLPRRRSADARPGLSGSRPGRSNAGIIPASIAGPGPIGLVSKSGTLTYQMMYELRDHGFLAPRGALYVAEEHDLPALDRFEQTFAGTGVTIERIGRAALEALVPGVKAGWLSAITEPHCADIDVAGLHQHYLSQARQGRVDLRVRHRLVAAEREGDCWLLAFANGAELRATTLVNAAGAWADVVALDPATLALRQVWVEGEAL